MLLARYNQLNQNMNTQELYQNAIKFAGEKHKNQMVPGTESNYLLHLSNVAMEILIASKYEDFNVDFAIQVALLHDSIEDTETTFDEIKEHFGKDIALAVLALTKNDKITDKKEKMIDSLNRINVLSKEVGMVKLADRITNLQKPPKTWGKEKIVKYLDIAKVMGEMLKNKSEYLNNRLDKKIFEYQKYLKK